MGSTQVALTRVPEKEGLSRDSRIHYKPLLAIRPGGEQFKLALTVKTTVKKTDEQMIYDCIVDIGKLSQTLL